MSLFADEVVNCVLQYVTCHFPGHFVDEWLLSRSFIYSQ